MAKYSLRLIRARRSYSVGEAALLLNVNRKTIFRWISEGLNIMEGSVYRQLIMGSNLKQFLKEKIEKKRCCLKEDEFFCPRCKIAVRARDGTVRVERTGRRIGNDGAESAMIKGKCVHCGAKLNRFTKVYH